MFHRTVLLLAFLCCTIASQQSSLDGSKYYGRYNGNISYQEKKLNQKLKVVVLANLYFVMLPTFLADVQKCYHFQIVLLFTVLAYIIHIY